MIDVCSNARLKQFASLLLASSTSAAMPLFASDHQNTLVDYQIVANGIPKPLTKTPGDSARGLEVFLDRARGHCLLCHSVASVAESSQGNIGPALDNVGDRLSKTTLRLRIVDGTTINPDTAMPAYYRVENLQQVGHAYQNKPVLSAQEVEDVVEWLSQLRASDAN